MHLAFPTVTSPPECGIGARHAVPCVRLGLNVPRTSDPLMRVRSTGVGVFSWLLQFLSLSVNKSTLHHYDYVQKLVKRATRLEETVVATCYLYLVMRGRHASRDDVLQEF